MQKVEITTQALNLLIEKAKENQRIENFSGKLERFVDAIGAKSVLVAKNGPTVEIFVQFDS